MAITPHPVRPDTDLELVRETDITPEAVWAAWTTPALIVQWFTPAPYRTTHAEIDLHPGGIFRTVMVSPEGDESDGDGCVLDVVPGERLVWTSALGPGFRPVPGPMPFTAVIEVSAAPGGGTRYRAVAMHQTPEDRQQHADMGFHAGWGAAFDQLVALMRSR
jgi:uncharacterized protein YndB with AHSA1/START domain